MHKIKEELPKPKNVRTFEKKPQAQYPPPFITRIGSLCGDLNSRLTLRELLKLEYIALEGLIERVSKDRGNKGGHY